LKYVRFLERCAGTTVCIEYRFFWNSRLIEEDCVEESWRVETFGFHNNGISRRPYRLNTVNFRICFVAFHHITARGRPIRPVWVISESTAIRHTFWVKWGEQRDGPAWDKLFIDYSANVAVDSADAVLTETRCQQHQHECQT